MNYTQWVEKLRATYGLSKRALFQDLEHCGITATGGTITIKPLLHVKLEAWEGFAPGNVPDITICANSPAEEVGSVLRQGFGYCVTGSAG